MKKVTYERAREILNELLKENNCLEEYFENIKNYNQGKDFVDKKKYEENFDMIGSEFEWNKTFQGNIFWNRMFMTFNQKLIEEEKSPPIKKKETIEIEVGSSTWAFHKMVFNGKKIKNKHLESEDGIKYLRYCDLENELLDEDGDERSIFRLTRFNEDWEIYEGE